MALSTEQQDAQDKFDFQCAWAWLLGVAALGAAIGVIYEVGYEVKLGSSADWWFKLLAMAWLAAFACWFIAAFTGDPYRKRTHAIILSYFFVVVSLLLLSVPTFLRGRSLGDEPVGVISGCVTRTQAKELLCREDEKDKAADKKDKAADKKDKKKASEDSKRQDSNADEKTLKNQWLINIGGAVSPQDPTKEKCPPGQQCRMFVTGGIAVPLYFVILALIGGAISISRRVPEIQKRSENDYAGNDKERKLQPGEVREMLAFQILQFVSAPLIAVTAYQIIQPDAMAASAALAFMCGFGSETILLMIRGVASGLKPESVTLASTGTVSGKVTDDGQPVVKIQVSVAGTSLKSKTDDDGSYTIAEVPVGDREVVVSEPNRGGKTRVSIQAKQTATADIRIQRTGSVKGKVTNAAGAAVKEASVAVVSQPSLKAVTDAAGQYQIDRVPVGDQKIEARHPAGGTGAPRIENVKVEFNKDVQGDIQLQ
jgi:hypothetical protein